MNQYGQLGQVNWQPPSPPTLASIIADAKTRIRQIDAAIDGVAALTAERDTLKAIIRAAEEQTMAELKPR